MVGVQRTSGFTRTVPGSNGPVDIRPIIFSVAFSLLLTTALIFANTGRQLGGVSAASAVETEAALVDPIDANEGAARQAVSPALARGVEGSEVAEGADNEQQEASADVTVDDIASADSDVPGDPSAPGAVGESNDQGQLNAAPSGDALALAEPADVAGGNLQNQNVEGGSDATRQATVPSPPTTVIQSPNLPPFAATTTQVSPVAPVVSVAPRVPTPVTPTPTLPSPTTTTTTSTTTSSSTTPPTTAAAPVFVSGQYSIAQVIDGTIGAGDGSNPNEDGPMGRHDAPLFLPQGWDWAQGSTRNSQWGNLRSNQFVEFRCAVIPENGHTPPVDFRINFRNGAYFQYANGDWSKAFDVALDAPSHGAYLGAPGQVNNDPFATGRGSIQWRQEADGSYSAPWNPGALMMHFWASERQSPASGQIAEFLTSEMRLQQPDGRTVDLSQVRVLFQCGLDYYNSTGGQGTRVPGPGIGKYHYLTPEWQPDLWVTLPGNASASSTGDFRSWLQNNLPPGVGS